MDAATFAIVVPPDVTRFVESDIAGRPAGDYLFGALAKLDGVGVRVLPDITWPARAEPNKRYGVVRFPLTAADASALAERDVLIVDARAWLPDVLLSSVLSRARRTGGDLRPVDSSFDRAGRVGMTLAFYFARGRLRPDSLERAQTTAGRGLEHVLSGESLTEGVLVAAPDLDIDEPALLVDSYPALSKIERLVLLDRANSAMERGVRIRDPHQVWLRGDLVCGSDVELEINVIVEGTVVLGNGVRIGANCVLRDSRIGDNTRINPFSLVEHASIGSDGIVGPYSRIRPASTIADAVQIGNYVEIKNSEVGSRSRINHHAFIGDAVIAED